ncbi:hypothetical protein CCM_00700 [Cordyceps militaris CM01]|uniref:Uncharacterized protein n=1 Tax=Cordyceps militaris (strain CM01) TaxID=983644 RepID=G3J5I4_CORMM|nr:uncharacterized protein CCM_00700 [Cordyceps militaris CM01]EGX96045.1 hypothetical protein CCM_00700 [Cordyceps militaris CM01]
MAVQQNVQGLTTGGARQFATPGPGFAAVALFGISRAGQPRMSPTASSQLLAEQHTFKQAALREWGAGTRAAVAGGAHKAQRNTRRECWPRPQQLLRAARTKPRNIQEGSAGRVPSGPLRESAAGPADPVGEIVRLGPESAIATLQSSGTFKVAGQFSQTELTSDRYFLGGPEVNHRRESGALTNRSVWLGSVRIAETQGDQKRQPAPISWRVWRGRLKGGGYRDWGRLWMALAPYPRSSINGGRGRDKQPDDSSISEEPQHQTAPGPGIISIISIISITSIVCTNTNTNTLRATVLSKAFGDSASNHRISYFIRFMARVLVSEFEEDLDQAIVWGGEGLRQARLQGRRLLKGGLVLEEFEGVEVDWVSGIGEARESGVVGFAAAGRSKVLLGLYTPASVDCRILSGAAGVDVGVEACPIER